MKAYVCDACGMAITSPWDARMREFYVGARVGSKRVSLRHFKTNKQKVHLCEDCFRALHFIAGAKRKGGEG